MDRRSFILFVMLAGLLLFGMGAAFADDSVPRMSKEELKAKLGSSDLVIIDVRGVKPGHGKERMIAGAVSEDSMTPEKWAGRYGKEKTLVLYCA